MRGSYFAAKTVINGASMSFDKHYDYILPEELADKAQAGMRALVPFGRGNRKSVALIIAIYPLEHYNAELKPVFALIDKEPLINAEMLNMLEWMKSSLFCTYFDAYKTMVPNGFSYKIKTHYTLANTGLDENAFTGEELALIEQVRAAKTQSAVDKLLSPEKGAGEAEKKHLKELVGSLLDKGALEEADFFKRAVGDETEQMVRLSESMLAGGANEKLSAKQSAVVKLLKELGSASAEEVCYMTGCTKAVLKRLEEKGAITVYKTEVMRKATADAGERRDPTEIRLNAEQTAAYEGIMQLVASAIMSRALRRAVSPEVMGRTTTPRMARMLPV